MSIKPDEAIEAVKRASTTLSNIAKAIEPFRPQLDELQSQFEGIHEDTKVMLANSIAQANTFFHPVYTELFEANFTTEDIENNWDTIRDWLVRRFPINMDFDGRKERFLQFLDCQNIAAYVAVCRSTYAEIESIFRDEFLHSDPQWVEERNSKEKASSRRGFQAKEISELLKNNHNEKQLVSREASPSELGPFNFAYALRLVASFDSFDPAEPEEAVHRSQRHIHCHGWAKVASFQNGLDALLLLDMTYQYISEHNKKEREQQAVMQ